MKIYYVIVDRMPEGCYICDCHDSSSGEVYCPLIFVGRYDEWKCVTVSCANLERDPQCPLIERGAIGRIKLISEPDGTVVKAFVDDKQIAVVDAFHLLEQSLIEQLGK